MMQGAPDGGRAVYSGVNLTSSNKERTPQNGTN